MRATPQDAKTNFFYTPKKAVFFVFFRAKIIGKMAAGQSRHTISFGTNLLVIFKNVLH